MNISVIRGHYPSFNGNARSALINYYELFEPRIVGHAGGRMFILSRIPRITRIFARAVSASLYSFHICAADICMGVYPRSSVPLNSLYSFWNVHMCVCTYEYKTRYCFVRNTHITMHYAIAQCIPALVLLISINNARLQMG